MGFRFLKKWISGLKIWGSGFRERTGLGGLGAEELDGLREVSDRLAVRRLPPLVGEPLHEHHLRGAPPASPSCRKRLSI